MLIGVPKEIKTHEYRVGLVPSSVRELVHHGHRVVVQTGAGLGIGFDDKAYKAAGAKIAKDAAEVFAKRSEEHTSELQSLMRISYAVFCLKKKNTHQHIR